MACRVNAVAISNITTSELFTRPTQFIIFHTILIIQGADKSLAQPGKKQANISVRMACRVNAVAISNITTSEFFTRPTQFIIFHTILIIQGCW